MGSAERVERREARQHTSLPFLDERAREDSDRASTAAGQGRDSPVSFSAQVGRARLQTKTRATPTDRPTDSRNQYRPRCTRRDAVGRIYICRFLQSSSSSTRNLVGCLPPGPSLRGASWADRVITPPPTAHTRLAALSLRTLAGPWPFGTRCFALSSFSL